eukprot:TRINITY_DN2533_c0_g1_i2.p1 TRINITY_DN2533_c0_g1~~TRINITY_DN2533_c0_g1_i2.p1  ORF type:complete len:652 (+),score=47.37 TRINITY_DN2533_c0_g1_i2:85-1956(+)
MSSGGHGTASARQQRPQSARLQGSSFRAAGAAACMLAAGLAWYVSRSSSVTGPRGLSKKVQQGQQTPAPAPSVAARLAPSPVVLTVGSRIDVLSPSGARRTCTILDADDKALQIHYEGFATDFDEWIARESPRIVRASRAVSGAAATGAAEPARIAPGVKVWVLSSTGKARLCSVVKAEATRIRVHYEGFKGEYDEWVELESPRILHGLPTTSTQPQRPWGGYAVGEELWVLSTAGMLSRKGKVVAVTGDKIQLQFDEPVEQSSPNGHSGQPPAAQPPLAPVQPAQPALPPPAGAPHPPTTAQPTPNSEFGAVHNGTTNWINSPTGVRRHATVVDTSPTLIKVHYTGFTTEFDEWVNPASSRFQGPAPSNVPAPAPPAITTPTPRHTFSVGQTVTALSPTGISRKGTVVAIAEDKVQLHYTGLSADHDEWLDAKSDRIVRQGGSITAAAPPVPEGGPPPLATTSAVATVYHSGDAITVQSPSGSWRSTTVLAAEPTRVKVHYNGFDSAYDEWVPIGPRIHSLSQPGSAPPPAPPSVALPPPPSVALPPPAAVAPPAVPAGPLPTYTVGQSVEVMSSTDQRRSTKVVQVEPGRIKVHYEGFDPWYDEWIDLGSPRLLGPAAPAK